MGSAPLLRGWLHAGAFFAWLLGGPFLIAAAPDAVGDGRVVGLRGRHARDVRDERGVPPAPLVGGGLAAHAAGRSQRDLRRDRRDGTAVAGLALPGWAEVLVLTMVWAGAAVGIALRKPS